MAVIYYYSVFKKVIFDFFIEGGVFWFRFGFFTYFRGAV